MDRSSPERQGDYFDSSSFLLASRTVLPLVIGSLPFAIITGAITVNTGISPFYSLLMSILISAGASQIAALDLVVKQAPMIVIILTGLIINLRLVMYSASIAPYIQNASALKKILLSFMLSDQAYAVSILEFTKPESTIHRISFYMGAAITVLVIWQIGVMIGILVGGAIPPSWSFDFAIPLTFLFLLVAVLRDRPSVAAAVAAGFISVATAGLPYNLNILLGAMAGILSGYYSDRRSRE